MLSRSHMVAIAAVVIAVVVPLSGCDQQESAPVTPPSTAATVAPAPADPELIKSYPLDVCVVSGEKLGDHGEPTNHMHEGRLVRFCCDSCLPDFNDNPAKYLAQIDQAAKAPKAVN